MKRNKKKDPEIVFNLCVLSFMKKNHFVLEFIKNIKDRIAS